MQTFRKKRIVLSLVTGCALAAVGPAHPALLETPGFFHPDAAGVTAAGAEVPSDDTVVSGDAAPALSAIAAPFQGWVAVDSDTLNRMRGGFAIAPGLMVSFGIERLVSLNGVLQTATRIEVPDAARMIQAQQATGAPAAASTQAVSADAAASPATAALPSSASAGNAVPGLLQNGLGNSFSTASLTQAAAATFIQNTLSNQTIQSITVINADTNSLELLKGANLQSTLLDALTRSAIQR